MGVGVALNKVEADIKAVDEKVEALDAEIKEARALRDKDELAALRADKARLLADKAQLREKGNLLLKCQLGMLSWRRARCMRAQG